MIHDQNHYVANEQAIEFASLGNQTEPQLPGLPEQLKGVRAQQCAFWEKRGFIFPDQTFV